MIRKLLFLLMAGLVSVAGTWAQTRSGTISGRVVDSDGNPVAGASVEIVNARNMGRTTDADGRFSFENFRVDATVSVTFVGMEPVQKKILLDRPETITMRHSSVELEEVVVTGMFNRPGETFTGSVKTLSGEQLKRASSINVLQALRNLEPSLNLIDNMEFGSDPNRLPNFELRGQSSFPLSETDIEANYLYQDNPNQPLIIMNGFEVSATRLIDLDMERIQSITILKDASAKAIYGAKAANGVFVIETKRSSGEFLSLRYRGTLDVSMPDLTSYDLTNAMEKLQVEMASGIYEQNTNLAQYYDNIELYNRRFNAVLAGTDVDWLSKPLRTGYGTKHTLTLDITDGSLSSLTDISYSDIAGVMKGSKRNTISGSSEFVFRLKDKLTFRNLFEIISNKGTDSPWGEFEEYANANPYDDPYDAEGNLVKSFARPNNLGDAGNPIWNTQYNTSFNNDYIAFADRFEVHYTPHSNLIFRLRTVIETQRDRRNRFLPGHHTSFIGDKFENDPKQKGTFEQTIGRKNTMEADFMVNYNKTWGKHELMNYFDYELGQGESHSVTYHGEGYPSDKMNDILFAQRYGTEKRPSGKEEIVRDMSFTGLVSYSYDRRFMADFTLRGSASSQYSPKRRWGAFWSAGLAWNMHKEKWAQDLGWLKELKLRGSVGTTGSENSDAYAHIVTYGYYTDAFYDMGEGDNRNRYGAQILRLANPDLRWEQKLDTNVGFDLKMWDRFMMTFDAYISTTKDLVTPLSLPTSMGYAYTYMNVGNVRNRGIEANIIYRLIDRDDFYLNLTGGIWIGDNEIIKISDDMREFNESVDSEFDQKYQDNDDGTKTPLPLRQNTAVKYIEGGPMSPVMAVKSYGIDPQTGLEVFLDRFGNPTYNWSAADQIIAGDSKEKYRGNVGFNGEWRGLGMSVILRYMGGGHMYNLTLVKKVENIDINNNVDRRVFTGRWTEDNKNAPYKAFRVWNEERGSWDTAPNTQPTTRFVQKRNEFDIAAVTIYYDLGRLAAFSNMGFRALRLGFNMNDIHKFSTIEIERGTKYPFARTMSFSLSAQF